MNMTCREIMEYIKDSSVSLFECGDVTEDYLQLMTPFFYPDGDEVDLYIKSQKDLLILTDLGETLRYLNTYAFNPVGTHKRKFIFNDIVQSHNIRYNNGQLYAIIKNPEKIFDAVINLSQAVVRISDLLYTSREHSVTAFEEEVRTLLEDEKLPFEENYSISTSHASYNFEFAVETPKGINVIKLLNSSTPGKIPNIANTIKMWFDIDSNRYDEFPKDNRITLLDDLSYPWQPSQYSLIENLSMVHKWTQKDKLVSKFKSAS